MLAPRYRERAATLRNALFGVAAALLLSSTAPAVADNAGLAEQGRRIYVDGILPDGSPLAAIRSGETPAAVGAEAACVHCHRNSGYGSVEGRILVPPTAGAVLFAPGVLSSTTGSGKRRVHGVVSVAERFRTRSAYDETSLRRALRDGVDPDGVRLQPPMARYRLDARSIKALAAYLRQLSDGPDPGIAGEALHLGTVITPDVPPSERDALLEVLRAYAATRNGWGMPWQLHVWQLTGAPEEWGAQLETHYRQQPVFALLSGAGKVEWQPVHQFCERRAVACILPSLELAPDSASDHYSLYFSPGLALEARLLVRQLASEPVPPQRLIQVVADEAGQRAAMTVQLALQAAGSPIQVLQVSPEEYAAMRPVAPDAVVWWLRPAKIAVLTAALHETAPPGTLYLSALLAPPDELAMPSGWKQNVHYVSVFDAIAMRRAQATLVPWLARQGLAATELRVRGDAFAACNFFSSAVSEIQLQESHGIRGPLTRERLFETLEADLTIYRDDNAPYYWQMSLGPAQRMLVKGGMVLHYAESETGGWVPLTARFVP